jgi:hypothetical protein
MSRLNETDLELIQTGQTVDLKTVENSYYGGEFTTNSNDCVETFIYDTNNNLLETGIADVGDYSYDSETGIKLNTGTILRKMGYDRGKYVVKFNFLRKVAGSSETVLVDSDRRIHNGGYHIMGNGKIMTGSTHNENSKELFLKEYKYFVHEISPSRTEVRLAPQSIEDKHYKTNFLDAQVTTKKIIIEPGSYITLTKDAQGDSLKVDSKTMKLNGTSKQLSKQMIGGFISINNAFIKEFLPPPSATDATQVEGATEELESSVIQAQFFISDDSQASYNKGDRFLTKAFEIFKDIPDTGLPVDLSIIEYPISLPTSLGNLQDGLNKLTAKDLLGIQKLKYSKVSYPIYKWEGGDNPNTITLKSNSSKPNVATKYTWELTGWDWDSNPSGWSEIKAYSDSYTNGDVRFENPTADGSSSPLRVEENSTEGSKVTISLHSKHINVGVKLTIAPKDGQPSTIHIPACIRVA